MPELPGLDEDASSRRAQTENDDRLETAMRETEHITAVEIDHEAKAAAAAAENAKSRRSDTQLGTGPNAIDHSGHIGDITAVGLAAAPPAPAFHPGDDAEFNRAGSQAEHTSQTRLPESLREREDVRREREDVRREREDVRREREDVRHEPEDLMKTIEHNPKTPIPSLDRVLTPAQEAERRAHVPITTAPTTLPPPKQLDAVPSGPTPACPQCEAPMAWVDEHLRFYCRRCRMYF
jgi:hypothetical protein